LDRERAKIAAMQRRDRDWIRTIRGGRLSFLSKGLVQKDWGFSTVEGFLTLLELAGNGSLSEAWFKFFVEDKNVRIKGYPIPPEDSLVTRVQFVHAVHTLRWHGHENLVFDTLDSKKHNEIGLYDIYRAAECLVKPTPVRDRDAAKAVCYCVFEAFEGWLEREMRRTPVPQDLPEEEERSEAGNDVVLDSGDRLAGVAPILGKVYVNVRLVPFTSPLKVELHYGIRARIQVPTLFGNKPRLVASNWIFPPLDKNSLMDPGVSWFVSRFTRGESSKASLPDGAPMLDLGFVVSPTPRARLRGLQNPVKIDVKLTVEQSSPSKRLSPKQSPKLSSRAAFPVSDPKFAIRERLAHINSALRSPIPPSPLLPPDISWWKPTQLPPSQPMPSPRRPATQSMTRPKPPLSACLPAMHRELSLDKFAELAAPKMAGVDGLALTLGGSARGAPKRGPWTSGAADLDRGLWLRSLSSRSGRPPIQFRQYPAD